VQQVLRGHVTVDADRRAIDEAFSAWRRRGRPGGVKAWRQETLFAVPVLAVKQGDVFEPFDDAYLLDSQWDLAKCSPELAESEYSATRPEAALGELDVDKDGRIRVNIVSKLQSQLAILSDAGGWNVGVLARWLDHNIPHYDISHESSGIYLVNVLSHLIDRRGIPLERLLHDKFRLRRAVEDKMNQHRQEARRKAHQLALLPSAPAPVVVDPSLCFMYDPKRYPYNTICSRSTDFKKHFYEVVGDLDDKGEEFECAQFLDGLDEVRCWVRNLERHERDSFWLQTATDKFYPDFVSLLHDGRVLVVEYKGADRWSNDDSKEKRRLGELWEARSKGKCLFVMPKGEDFSAIESKVRNRRE